MKRFISMIFIICLFLLLPGMSSAAGDTKNAFQNIMATAYDANENTSMWRNDSTHMSKTWNAYDNVTWLCFQNVDFGAGATRLVAAIGTGNETINGKLQLKLDKKTNADVASFKFEKITGFSTQQEWVINLYEKVSGVHDVYISVNRACAFYYFYFETDSVEQSYENWSERYSFPDVESSKYEHEIDALYQLGIISDVGPLLYDPKQPVSRSEFAVWAAHIMTDDIPVAKSTVFSDVTKDLEGFNEINYLYERKILSLNDTASFSPYDFITTQDAAVILLRILGYDDYCKYQGGYPWGYNTTAIKLFKSYVSDFNAAVSRESAAGLLYSAIRAEYLMLSSVTGTGKNEYSTAKGIMNITRGISMGTGVMTANYFSGLTNPNALVSKDLCIIGTERFIANNVNVNNLLGVKCDFFYKTDSNGNHTLMSILPAKAVKQTYLTSNKHEILDFSHKKIKYVDEDGFEKTIDIPSNANWIYNNRALKRNIDAVVTMPDFRGTIRLIDNGNHYETVVVEEYKTLRLKTVDLENQVISDELTGEIFDFSNALLILSDGTRAAKSRDVNIGDVVSLYISDDEELVSIVVGQTEVSGQITEQDHESGNVVIDGTEYALAKEFSEPVFIGKSCIAVLNRQGEIAYLRDNCGINKVGILLDITNVQDILKIKIFTEENKATEFLLAEKFFVDGERVSDFEELINGVNGFKGFSAIGNNNIVLYRTGEAGRLTMIDTTHSAKLTEKDTLTPLFENPNNEQFNYCVSEKMFNRQEQFFMPISNNGKLVIIDAFYPELLSKIMDISEWTTNQGLIYSFYSTSPDSIKADIAVMKSAAGAGQWGAFGLFDSYSEKVNEHGDVGREIKVLEGKTLKKYFVLPDSVDLFNAVKTLQKGDYVSIATLGNDMVANIRIGCFRDGRTTPLISGASSFLPFVDSSDGLWNEGYMWNSILYGTVGNVEDGYIVLNVFGRNDKQTIPVKKVPLYEYDSATDKISMRDSLGFIIPGDRIIVRVQGNVITAGVVYR